MPWRPHLYAFSFGTFRITSLLDAVDIRSGLAANFALGQPEALVRQVAMANFIDPDRYEHPFIPILIETGTKKILFDTGLGDPGGMLLAGLQEIGVGPADIDTIVLTHGHPDHTGGLLAGGSPVFTRAHYVFGAAEFDFWMHSEDVRAARLANRDLFRRTCAKLAGRATFINPGDEISPGITAIDAAGHSPGLVAYRISSGAKRLLMVGYLLALCLVAAAPALAGRCR